MEASGNHEAGKTLTPGSDVFISAALSHSHSRATPPHPSYPLQAPFLLPLRQQCVALVSHSEAPHPVLATAWEGDDLCLLLPQPTETAASISKSALEMSVLKLNHCCVETMTTRGGVCRLPPLNRENLKD